MTSLVLDGRLTNADLVRVLGEGMDECEGAAGIGDLLLHEEDIVRDLRAVLCQLIVHRLHQLIHLNQANVAVFQNN